MIFCVSVFFMPKWSRLITGFSWSSSLGPHEKLFLPWSSCSSAGPQTIPFKDGNNIVSRLDCWPVQVGIGEFLVLLLFFIVLLVVVSAGPRLFFLRLAVAVRIFLLCGMLLCPAARLSCWHLLAPRLGFLFPSLNLLTSSLFGRAMSRCLVMASDLLTDGEFLPEISPCYLERSQTI
jgi:hypothetical protein